MRKESLDQNINIDGDVANHIKQDSDIKKVLEVRAIENGTVIDHIPSDSLFKVIRLLKLDNVPNQITFGMNLQSRRIGRKAIIKISDLYCHDTELSCLALVAPSARINIIRDYEVVDKREVSVPKIVEGMVKCANPMCITNYENVKTSFRVSSLRGQLSLECLYCEKVTSQEQIEVVDQK